MSAQTILVSNGTNDSGLAAIRSLARAGFRVLSFDTRPLPRRIRSRYAEANFAVAGSSQSAYEQSLLEIVRAIRPHALLALGTSAVLAAIRQGDCLRGTTAVLTPPFSGFTAAFNKSVCMRECRALNIPVPREYRLEDARDALQRAQGSMTLVVKPDVDAGAANGVHYVRTEHMLLQAVDDVRTTFGGVCIQEYIPGDADAMSTVVLLFSATSRLVAAFTTRKSRQSPCRGGATAASHSTAAGDLVARVMPFFQKWRWQGAAEVELKYDHRDGTHKVIEINPRYPGYVRFAVHCGLDLPLLATRLALDGGADVAPTFPAYRTDRAYLNPGLYVRSIAEELRQSGRRANSLRSMLNDFRTSWPFVRDMLNDPLPMIARGVVDARGGARGDSPLKESVRSAAAHVPDHEVDRRTTSRSFPTPPGSAASLESAQ